MTAIEVPSGIKLFATDLDGTLLSWPRYLEGMAQFQRETYPLVVQAGLHD